MIYFISLYEARQLRFVTFIGSPKSFHTMPHKHNSGQLSERLSNVEVTERADLEECDAQSLCKSLGVLGGHLTLIGQVKPVSHQDLGNTRCMLGILEKSL